MKVIEEWAVSAMFLDVLLKFGDQPKVFEESSGFRQATQNPEGSFGKCPTIYRFVQEPRGD